MLLLFCLLNRPLLTNIFKWHYVRCVYSWFCLQGTKKINEFILQGFFCPHFFFFTFFTELVFLQLQMCLSKLFVCVCVCVAGLLLCYELPVQTDRDGRPIDRFLISRSRSYQQTLTALIHEVSLILFLLCLSHSVVLTKLLLVVFDV